VLNGYLGNEHLIKLFQGGKFELKMLATLGIALRPPYFDTMLVSQILQCGQQEGSKLEALSQRYLGVALDKSLQTSFLDLPPGAMLIPEQIGYASEDVLVLLKLYEPMQATLKQYQSSVRTWKREQQFLPLVAALEMGGVRFHEESLLKLRDRLAQQVGTYKRYTEGALVGEPAVWSGYDPVNLDSLDSVKAAMIGQGIPYHSNKDSDLLQQADEPAVMHLLQYRYLKRRLEQVEVLCQAELCTQGHRQFHRLPKYSQLEYLTGRLSHSHTGVEALMPWDDEEQERFIGSLLRARSAGRALIGVKLKEVPLRVLAQVSGDAVLRQLYAAEGSGAVTRLAEALGIDHALSWALWMGAGVYGYRKVSKWQEFAY
jgi:DNA polymerase I-like protein with 3'-5' exonuclease and polymerase domains